MAELAKNGTLRVEKAKHGFLYKRGAYNKQFKKRLFRAWGALPTLLTVAHSQCSLSFVQSGVGSAITMAYFQSIHDSVAQGTINLKGSSLTAPANSTEFYIKTNERTYVLKGVFSWLNSLSEMCRHWCS